MTDLPRDTLTLESRVRPSDKTLFRNVEGEAVLLGLNAGAYFGLDPVGTRIWELISERGVLRDVLDGIVQEYEVDAARAEADLMRLVRELLARDLILLDR